MPRRDQTRTASAFRQVQQQARQLLGNLRRDIRGKETALRRLQEEEQRLGMLTGRVQAAVGTALTRARGGRVNWRAVLEKVPKQFKASDIRGFRGLKDKRPSEIFAAITRWSQAGMVKRKSRGVYERA